MQYHKIIIRLSLVFVLIFNSNLLYAKWYDKSWAQMGTKISAKLWADTDTQAEKAFTAIRDEMRRIDEMMSPYIPTSELSLINKNAAKRPTQISDEMFEMITVANKVSEISQGIFDITFASIGHQYDYRKKIRPDETVIAENLPALNYQHIHLNHKNKTISFHHARVKIDLGGIAKGYAVERCIRIVQQLGIKHAVITAGGDSMMLGDKRGKPWIIGIQDPRNPDQNAVILPLADTAMSTSGDYERYFIQDNKRYHHILSPKTGKPADFNRSVSVIGNNATLTDALSTTLFILPSSKGLKLLENYPGYDAIIIDKNGKLQYSAGLNRTK